MTTHCIPEPDRPSSETMLGAAIETTVWSMYVIATAHIIAASASGCEVARPALVTFRPRVRCVPVTRPVCADTRAPASAAAAGPRPSMLTPRSRRHAADDFRVLPSPGAPSARTGPKMMSRRLGAVDGRPLGRREAGTHG
ncbi:hypothetical protein GCM10010335_24760 [Streptomyces galbus]|nr:hypothetical protein GCM10010335_24760 [Streptomyces galbus]